MTHDDDKGLLFREACRLLGRSVRTVRRWIRSGVLRAKKINGSVYVNREDVAAIVNPAELDETEG